MSSYSSSSFCTLESIHTCPEAGGEMQAQPSATLTAGIALHPPSSSPFIVLHPRSSSQIVLFVPHKNGSSSFTPFIVPLSSFISHICTFCPIQKPFVAVHRDRCACGRGTYSVLQVSSPEPGRQVTLLSADEVDVALQEAGIDHGIAAPNAAGETKTSTTTCLPREYGTFRRNLVDRGPLVASNGNGNATIRSNDTIGKGIQIGNQVVLFVNRACVPCMYNKKRIKCRV